jgi:hypothetical protein
VDVSKLPQTIPVSEVLERTWPDRPMRGEDLSGVPICELLKRDGGGR